MLAKKANRLKRHRRIRAKISGTVEVPRLCVFRSNKHIYAQLIDDSQGSSRVLLSASDRELDRKSLDRKNVSSDKEKGLVLTTKVKLAFEVGRVIGEKALKKGIKKAIFDRGGYKYHGRVRAVAEGAREAGLKF